MSAKRYTDEFKTEAIMHLHKTVMLAALFGLSLFILGLAVGQGWFHACEAQAQTTSGVYPGPEIAFLALQGNDITLIDVEGYWWLGDDVGGEARWTRRQQFFAPGTPIPTGQESLGGLKGSYNK